VTIHNSFRPVGLIGAWVPLLILRLTGLESGRRY
jgi:hypothetical protein